MITENNFGTGGIISERNEMIASFSEVVADSPTFDWNKGFDIREKVDLSLKNQGSSGSCGGQSSSYLTEALIGDNDIKAEFSARSIYAKCFVGSGGSSEWGLINTILNNGVATENDVTSYENGQPPTEQFMQTDYTAPKLMFKGARPVYINISFEEIALALLQNKGVVIGLSGMNNGTWLSADPTPPNVPPRSQGLWNHWVYVGYAGMRNGKKTLGFKNSWGNIGENGWQYITEDYVPYIWCAWSMIYVNKDRPLYVFTSPLLYRTASKDIRALQDILRYEGLFNNPSTGYYGDLTAGAVMSFQKKYKVASIQEIESLHGKRVGQLTINKLNQLYAK